MSQYRINKKILRTLSHTDIPQINFTLILRNKLGQKLLT